MFNKNLLSDKQEKINHYAPCRIMVDFEEASCTILNIIRINYIICLPPL